MIYDVYDDYTYISSSSFRTKRTNKYIVVLVVGFYSIQNSSHVFVDTHLVSLNYLLVKI